MPQNKSPFTVGTPQPVAPTQGQQQRKSPFTVTEPQQQRKSPFTVTEPQQPLQPPVSPLSPQALQKNILAPTISRLAPVFDVLSRPQYASARFFDSFADDAKSFLDTVSDTFDELLPAKYAKRPQQKLSFSDVIKKRDPEFAKNNPTATTILGFIGDVALDPTSYLGVGWGKQGVKLGSNVASEIGEELLKKGINKASKKVFVGADGILNLVEQLPKIEQKADRTIRRAKAFEDRFQNSVVRDDTGELRPLYHGTSSMGEIKRFDLKRSDPAGYAGRGIYLSQSPEIASKYTTFESTAKAAIDRFKRNTGGNETVYSYYANIRRPFDFQQVVDINTIANLAKVSDTRTASRLNNLISAGRDVTGEEVYRILKGSSEAESNDLLKKVGFDGIKYKETPKINAPELTNSFDSIDEANTFAKQVGGDVSQGASGKFYVDNPTTWVAFSPRQIVNVTSHRGVFATRQIIKELGVFGQLKTLEEKGYFQAVKERANEINALIDNPELAQSLAKGEVLSDLKRVGSDTLTSSEVRERVENRILKLLNTDPTAKENLLAKKGLYIKAGLPFGKQRDLVRIAGSDKVADSIKSLNAYLLSAGKFGQLLGKAEDLIGGVFNRNYNLPQEYVDLRDELENFLGAATDDTIRNTRKLFQDVSPEGRKKIGDTMQWIDDQTRILEQLRRADNPAYELSQDEALDVVKRGLTRGKLDAKEQAVVAQLYQNYKDMATIEMRANLLKHNLVNYSPRGYNAILDEGDMTTITRGKFRDVGGPNPYLSSSQNRKYLTNAEAKAAGLDLELDAAVLYANRLLSHQRAVAVKQFKDSVTELFGTYTPNPKYAHTGILPTGQIAESDLPKRVLDDMRMIGESVLPSGLSETTKSLLKFVDAIQRPFKRTATVYRPTFAARQLSSNTIQAAMISGAKAFKAFDPRSAIDAALLFFRDKKTNQLPEFLNNLINKNFSGSDAVLAQRFVMSNIAGEERLQDFAQHFKLRNPFGEEITGTELVDEMRKHGIFREFDSTGEPFSKKLTQELDRNFSNKAVAGELAKYWKHSQMVEDYNRAMLYINGRRLGHSADESAKIVNKALFDYQRGLSGTEKNIIRRLVPFYTFQRFAIPYVLKQILKQSGSPLTIQKFVGTVEKLISSGESLNPAEREQIPGHLLEQPFLYKGFDKEGKAAFNVLNNLTPFDVLNFMVYDKNGDVDYKRTVEKSVLGAITPFIKVPAEMFYNRNIFTQKTIEEASKLGDLSNLSNSPVGKTVGATKQGLRNVTPEMIKRVIPQPVKDLLSWEDRTDPRTGKTTSYMNPYLAYSMMNYFPILRDFIKPLDGATSPLEFASNFFLESLNPIKGTSVDLKAQSEFELLKQKNEFDDTLKELKQAIIKGSDPNNPTTKAGRTQKHLQNLMQAISENAKLQQEFKIRGQGLGQVQTEEQQQGVQNPTPSIPQPFR